MSNTIYEGHDLDALSDMSNYYKWIMDIFAGYVRGRVIEYGSGIGTVTQRLLPMADSLVAVEPSNNLIPALSSRLHAHRQVEICNETLESHVARQEPNSCDTVVIVNVLEHIADDQMALKELIRTLRPNGSLLLFVPALRALMSRLDHIHGHVRRYQKSDLEAKVKKAGAEIIRCSYFDSIGVFPWLFLYTLMGLTKFNTRLVRFNDRYVVPVTKNLEQRIDVPFGKNLILIATKK
jgi:SAM-dependent methyltransferase